MRHAKLRIGDYNRKQKPSCFGSKPLPAHALELQLAQELEQQPGPAGARQPAVREPGAARIPAWAEVWKD